MSQFAIHAEDLSKEYTIRAAQPYYTLREDLARAMAAPFNRLRRGCGHRTRNERIWALKGVSFEVNDGEVLGVIGRNGAGKSTLLKILSRITMPSEGQVAVRGRVASLLEIGTGFHPELTGRENIFLNGAILGMTRKEVQRKFDEILDFAGVERFVDTPVKHYSSGMYMRLAFAIAAHIEADILLVDEVLAVGDAGFQKKCLSKMQDVAGHGQTVLFVSHNLGAVRALTHRCIYLDKGSIVASGPSAAVIEKYLALSLRSRVGTPFDLDSYRRTTNIDSIAKIKSVKLLCDNSDAATVPTVPLNAKVTFEIGFEVLRSVKNMHASIFLKDSKGDTTALMVSLDNKGIFSFEPGTYKILAHIEELPLSPEHYFAEVGLGKISQPSFDIIYDLPLFHVANIAQVADWPERPWGALHLGSIIWEAR